MSIGQILLNRAIERGLVDVEPKVEGVFVLRVKVLGMWIGVVSITEQEVKEAS